MDIFKFKARPDVNYGEKLLALDILPLASNREIEDPVLFYKAFYGYIDIDVVNNILHNF